MSGTYSDPKGHKRHIPGKVDHDADTAKDVLVDGNGSPTKIGTETLLNGDAGEDTRGVGQVNISAMPVQKTAPSTNHQGAAEAGSIGYSQSQPVLDERQPKVREDGTTNNQSATSEQREQRQYPDGNKPKPDSAG